MFIVYFASIVSCRDYYCFMDEYTFDRSYSSYLPWIRVFRNCVGCKYRYLYMHGHKYFTVKETLPRNRFLFSYFYLCIRDDEEIFDATEPIKWNETTKFFFFLSPNASSKKCTCYLQFNLLRSSASFATFENGYRIVNSFPFEAIS